MTGAPAVSIVIPVRNEQGNIGALAAEIAAACVDGPAYEVLFVDDASEDGTPASIQRAGAANPRIRSLRHAMRGGQSAAIHTGVEAARGALVVTLDGDGQNPPAEIPKLLAPLIGAAPADLGLVAGERVDRKDTASKRLASRLANALRRRLLRDDTRDTCCGLKAFRRDAFMALPYFDGMHRYLPALFQRDGWRVVQVAVGHRPRGAGQSNYTNLQRAVVGLPDLLAVAWLIARRKKVTRAEEPRAEGERAS